MSADAEALERDKASFVVDLMDRLGPSGWGTIDYVLHASALQGLPPRTLTMLVTLVPARTKKRGS